MTALNRMSSGTVLSAVGWTRTGFDVEAARQRITRLYARATGAATTVVLGAAGRWALFATHLSTEIGTPARHGLPVVWGAAIGDSGEIGRAEVDAILRAPENARSLLGTFVVCGALPDGTARLVSSSDFIHTLKAVATDDLAAVSTRGLGSHALVDHQPRISVDAVVDLMAFEFVLGDRELLVATRVLPDAVVVDITPDGRVHEGSYWPLDERLAPGPPTSPGDLREVLGDVVERLGYADSCALGLTAGRDSSLVASCADERGVALRAFTFGAPEWPDAAGAAKVAAELGWDHAIIPPANPPPPPPADLGFARRISLWTEGLELGRNLLDDAPLPWQGTPAIFVAGTGGEIGRAFYWHGRTAGSPVERLVEGRLGFTTAAEIGLRQRLAWELGTYDVFGRDRASLLDVFYVLGRVRKWSSRARPVPWVTGTVAAYTHPSVARVLLDLPEATRASQVAFAEAAALWTPDLMTLAAAAAEAAHRLSSPTSPSRPVRKLPHRLRPTAERALTALPAAARGGVRQRDPLLGRTLDLLDWDLPTVAEAVGPRRVHEMLARLALGTAPNILPWYAVAVEMFAQELRTQPALW